MYICNDSVCDPVCDFCWYCVYDKVGTPVKCDKDKVEFDDGLGYCDDFKCSLHEPKPQDCRTE